MLNRNDYFNHTHLSQDLDWIILCRTAYFFAKVFVFEILQLNGIGVQLITQIKLYYIGMMKHLLKFTALSLLVSGSIAQAQVRLNQLGFLPDAPKRFEIPVLSGMPDSFQVLDSLGNVVRKGALGSPVLDAASAESLRRGDFSAMQDTGYFQIRVGTVTSPSFHISSHVYDRLVKDAAHTLRLSRANDSLLDTAIGIHHGPSHQQDSALLGKDLRGGWYNAADYGKWTHTASFAVAHIFWLNELRPELSSQIPDLMDEARWGLDWLFRMQQADGTVIHKVDTEGCWGWGKAPDKDICTRQASFQEKGNLTPSTIDAAALAAVMAQAYRNFIKSDPTFAKQCSTAAVLSWNWAKANPSVTQKDPYYTFNSTKDEMTWASGEIYALNGDASALSVFRNNSAGFAPNAPTWATPGLLGYLAIIRSPLTPASLKDSAQASLVSASRDFQSLAQSSGYGQALSEDQYYWGSNSNALGKAVVMAFDYQFTGDTAARNCALAQLDYVLGRNALEVSMVTGSGSVRTLKPYHWIYKVYQIAMPGWLSGGPNSYSSGADPALLQLINAGTPAAKCWLDNVTSYASNEGSIDQNAPLMFLAGYFSASTISPLPPSHTLVAKQSREPRTFQKPVDAKGRSVKAFDLIRNECSRSPSF